MSHPCLSLSVVLESWRGCLRSINREIKRTLIYEYRCDESLKTKKEQSTRLTDTGLVVELEHLKTKTRFLFIMNKKIENYREDLYMSIGVMKDQKIKRRNLHASQTCETSM